MLMKKHGLITTIKKSLHKNGSRAKYQKTKNTKLEKIRLACGVKHMTQIV